jgi:putative membrane protein
MEFLARLAINAFAIWLASEWLEGIVITKPVDDTTGYVLVVLVIGLVFTVVNMIIKPVVTILALPLLILTLGLFTLVINALMLMLTGWVTEGLNHGLVVDGFWAAFWAALLISIVNIVLGALVPNRR